MKLRGSLIFATGFLLVFILFLVATLPYPVGAKTFPLIASSLALPLCLGQLLREGFTSRQKAETAEIESGDRKYLGVAVWMIITVAMFWSLGFLATVILLPFLYLRYQRERWLLSIALPLGSGVFFYVLFTLALKMPLYEGLLFLKIFG